MYGEKLIAWTKSTCYRGIARHPTDKRIKPTQNVSINPSFLSAFIKTGDFQ